MEDCSASQLVDIDPFIEVYSETKAAVETLVKFEGANSVKLHCVRLQFFDQNKLIIRQILQRAATAELYFEWEHVPENLGK